MTPVYHASARLLARLAGILGRREDAERYAGLEAAIARAWTARHGVGAGPANPPTQSTELFAMALGLIPPPDRQAHVAWLLDDIRGRDGHLSTGILGTKFAFDVLSTEGYTQTLFDVVRQRSFPGWGYMLAHGATTLWEHWALSADTYSHNHPMFGSVSQWFFNWLGGIQADPSAVGFDRIILRPQVPEGLDWVRCSYRSVRGLIVSNWSRADGVLTWTVTVPVNATATAFLPADSLDQVREGATLAREAVGVRDAHMDGHEAVFTLGSGTYRFVTRRGRR